VPEQRVPALDGVRGLAILLVLIAHFRLVAGATLADRLYNTAALGGYSGVDLFFVLSGFLITGILLDAKGNDRTHYFRDFYARRALRILPLYYGVVAGLVLIWPHLHAATPPMALMRHNQWWYWCHATNILWAATKGAGLPYNTGHFWSLAVEEQFYLVWPVVVLLTNGRTLFRVAIGCIVAALVIRIALVSAGVSDFWIYSLPFTRLDTLAVGALLAVRAHAPGGLAPWRRPAVVVAAIAALAWGALYWLDQYRFIDPLFRTVGYTAAAAMYGGLIVLAMTAAPVQKIFGHPLLRFFGTYSYGMYVFHAPLMIFMAPLYAIASRVPSIGGTSLLGQLAFFLMATAITSAVAFASWHLYERPFLALKRYFR
jgi:peptidoglycan/LPS O-acetylase OafA/YrhL